MNADKGKGERFNTEDTEKGGEKSEKGRGVNRRDAEDAEKGERDPSAGVKQRRRPQDDDAGWNVRETPIGRLGFPGRRGRVPLCGTRPYDQAWQTRLF